MKIAIDVSPLTTGHAGRGIGTYTDLLVKALEKYEINNTYKLFTRKQNIPKDVDLVHIPYFDPFILASKVKLQLPCVVTVHDLIPLAYPVLFPRGIRGEIKWQIQKYFLKQADRIVTDSESSKKDIMKYTGYPGKNIHVIYLAPAINYRHITDNNKLVHIRDKYGLRGNFLLYVGDVNRNKNIINLVRAFGMSTMKIKNMKLSLVLVGKAFRNNKLSEIHEINNEINIMGIGDKVIETGFVDDADLSCIYSLATGYIQPSVAEGFGLPVLEAMSCGCPVIVSDRTSLYEIAGPAILCDPYSVSDMSEKIIRLVGMDEAQRQVKIMAGYDWVKRFTWQKVARETTLVYEKVFAK
jgi:glycosyltransferase involved in cell wall biosynthesis